MTDLIESAPSTRLCTNTSLRLVAPPAGTTCRIGRTKYGAMSPQLRDAAPDRSAWGRWDTQHGRTLYAAANVRAAFAEVVPYLRENLPRASLDNFFDDVTEKERERGVLLSDAVRAEMPSPGLRDAVIQGWREDRTIYELQLPGDGWFIDVYAAETIAAINGQFSSADGDRITISNLTGDDRSLTTRVATWLREQTLDDGSRPHGIQYLSKHGSNLTAYAVWLRALDDGKAASSELTRCVSERAIARDDADLVDVAGWNGIHRIW